jgi:hypothetical protein
MKFNKEESMELININHDLMVGMADLLRLTNNMEQIEKVKEVWGISDRLRNLIDNNLFGVN